MLQIEKQLEAIKRSLLMERLDQLSQKQRDFFSKLYPKGVSEKDLVSAIDLCDRTIKKNEKDPFRKDL